MVSWKLGMRQATDFVYQAWSGMNVGHKCSFSEKRLLQLHSFMKQEKQLVFKRWLRVAAVVIWTPVPCLMAALLSEILPLAPPSAGPKANVVFWVRSWFVQSCFTYALLVGLVHCIPVLPQQFMALIPLSLLVSVAYTATHFVTASTLGFPVPFSNLVLAAPWFALTIIALWIYIGRDCRSSSLVLDQLKKFAFVVCATSSLAIIYPLFYYAFLIAKSYPHTQIVLTVLVLPTIKLLEKLLLHRLTCHIPDLQPAYIAFNVEVFNALFISSCMRNATSITVTVCLMVVDFLSSSAALYGLRNFMAQVDEMNAKMSSSLMRGDMLDIAAYIISSQAAETLAYNVSEVVPERKQNKLSATVAPLFDMTSSTRFPQRNAMDGKFVFKAGSVAALPVLPSKPPFESDMSTNTTAQLSTLTAPSSELLRVARKATQMNDTVSMEMITHLSPEEQRDFVVEARRVLSRVETMLIIEYTEVIVPIFYAIYFSAVYYLPNRVYFPYLHDLSETELASTIRSVLLYGMLQLLSFILLAYALSQHFQLIPSGQLHFVLLREGKLVQSLLTLWVMYVLQTPLEHVGTDYTFKFEWLNNIRQ